MEFDYTVVLTAIIAGLTYALSGYLKTVGEKWDWLKFFTTVVIGIVTGAVVAYSDWELDMAYNFIISLGAIAIVENILKAIWRKIVKA